MSAETRPAPETVVAERRCDDTRAELRAHLVLALAGALLLSGCAMFSNSAPLPPPYDLTGDVILHRGAGLRRKTTLTELADPDPDPANVHRLHLRVDQLEHLPATTLAPLVGQAELVATENSDAPIRHAVYLVQGARVGAGDAARALQAATRDGQGGRWSTLIEREVALPTVMSAEITLSARAEPPRNQDYPRTPETENPLRNRVVFNLGRHADGSYALVIGLADGRELRGRSYVSAPTDFSLEENAVVPSLEVVVSAVVPEVDGGPLALALASPFAGPGKVLVIYAEVRPAPGAEADDATRELHAQAVELALAEGAESQAAAQERAEPLSETEELRLVRQRIFALLRAEPDRVGLVYLTGTIHAWTALDMVLVAEEEELAEYAERALPQGGRVSERPLSLELVKWHLEREALRLMARKVGDATLSPELRGVLLRHVGEVGRFPGMLEDAVKACANPEQLGQRLVAENRLFLEDSDPSARVRAYDWLRFNGGVPEGYDPLSSRDERRAALEHERDRLRDLAREAERASLADERADGEQSP